LLAVIGVILAFALIVGLRLRNVNFSASIVAGSLVIALTSVDALGVLREAASNTAADPTTLKLASAVALITVLGYSLKETNLMAELIDGLRGVLPSRILLALIPAVFGLLSMPGGALMSAPFNEPEAERLGLRPEHKTYINVWFRHLWYWASPISSVTILATSLADVSLNRFLAAQLPLFAVTLAIGFFVSGMFIKKDGRISHGFRGSREVFRGLAPIGAAIVLSTLGLPLWIALAAGIALIFNFKRMSPGKALGMAWRGIRWDVVAAVVATMFFRHIALASGSVVALFDVIAGTGVPLIVIFIVVPLLVGAISGTPTTGIGIVFPLLLPLCGSSNLHMISVIYAGLVGGYLASPMHLCLVLTNSYYKSEMGKVYRYLVPSTALLYVVAIVYHLMLNGSVP